MLVEEVVEELAMRRGNPLVELVLAEPALPVAAHELRRQEQVDTVRLVADLLLDPLELGAQVLGAVRGDAEDAHAAGLRHRGGDVAAMGEREDREFEAEFLREFGVHGGSP